MSRIERKRNIIGGLLLALAIVLMATLIFQNWQASTERDTAQSSAATSAQQKKNLAEEVADACESGQVVMSSAGVDLCTRAATIAQQPVSVEGPQGPAGPRGLPGADGSPGKTGKAGPDGASGIDGTDGLAGSTGSKGLAGLNGLPGAPGPIGPPGPAGADGETGSPGTTGETGPAGPTGSNPESFTFTDSTGHTYNCTPEPPGSLTYTCTAPTP